MEASWGAGVAWYTVDLDTRTCTYRSPAGDVYVEHYPHVDIESRTTDADTTAGTAG